MKKDIFIKKIPFFLISMLLLLILGCGFEKKDLNDIRLLDDNEIVNYNTDSGKYDLSKYLFPSTNQISIYQMAKYRDNQGDRNYDDTAPSKRVKQVKYIIEGNSIKEGFDANYTIEDFTIKEIRLIDDFYGYRDYRRFVDINDTFYSYEHVDNKKTFYQIGWVTCRVMEHNSSISILGKEYKDVLKLVCKSKSQEGVRGEFKNKKRFITEFFFAKDIGEIGVYGEECNIKEYSSIYKSCIKTTKELENILK